MSGRHQGKVYELRKMLEVKKKMIARKLIPIGPHPDSAGPFTKILWP